MKKMFQDTIGSGSGPIYEPIKHLRRGVEVQMVAPKVSTHRAADTSTAIGCTELIELSAYVRDHREISDVRCVTLFDLFDVSLRNSSCDRRCEIPWSAVLSGSLVNIEVHIRIAPLANQPGHRVRYELCSISVVDDTIFQT